MTFFLLSCLTSRANLARYTLNFTSSFIKILTFEVTFYKMHKFPVIFLLSQFIVNQVIHQNLNLLIDDTIGIEVREFENMG